MAEFQHIEHILVPLSPFRVLESENRSQKNSKMPPSNPPLQYPARAFNPWLNLMLRAASCLLPKWLLALRYVYNRKGQICEILVYDASSPKKESFRSRILATLRGREEIPLTKRFPNTSNHKLMVWSPTCPCLTVSYDNLWDGCSSLLQPLA